MSQGVGEENQIEMNRNVRHGKEGIRLWNHFLSFRVISFSAESVASCFHFMPGGRPSYLHIKMKPRNCFAWKEKDLSFFSILLVFRTSFIDVNVNA